MNKKTLTAISTIASFSAIKLSSKDIDPYTRTAVGLLTAIALSLNENQVTRNIGVGLGVASFLQLLDVRKGGRLLSNLSLNTIYILDETKGVIALAPGEIPDNSIDGITIKGLQGVFKVSDGIHIEVGKRNNIKYAVGVGKIINENLRSGGFKTIEWVNQQVDTRWKELYNKSF
jgi:hypothetical protein